MYKWPLYRLISLLLNLRYSEVSLVITTETKWVYNTHFNLHTTKQSNKLLQSDFTLLLNLFKFDNYHAFTTVNYCTMFRFFLYQCLYNFFFWGGGLIKLKIQLVYWYLRDHFTPLSLSTPCYCCEFVSVRCARPVQYVSYDAPYCD